MRINQRIKKEVKKAMENTDFSFLEKITKEGQKISTNIDNLKTPFEKPTLILTGRQDKEVGYKDTFNILNNYPRATFCVLDKAGHNLQIEQEKIFNQLVREWIYRLEEVYK